MKTKVNAKCLHKISSGGKFCVKCGKKMNILKRIFIAKEQLNNDDTVYICNVCYASNRFSYNFCNNCGNNLKPRPIPPIPCTPPTPSKSDDERNTNEKYLSEIGLLHLSEEMFEINIEIEGKRIKIQLKGYQRSGDALAKLRELGFLQNDKSWRFKNWPRANPCIGPFYHHVSACVCELGKNCVYYIESYDISDISVLYGCPNPSSINYKSRLDMACVEVVDYGKQ